MANYKMSKRVRVADAKPWNKLGRLIADYADAKIAESWKGGGDPNDIEVLEAQLDLARAKLQAHVAWMRANLDSL